MPEETTQAGTIVDDSALQAAGTVFAPEPVEAPQAVDPNREVVSAVTSEIARKETDKNIAILDDETKRQADLEVAEKEKLAATVVGKVEPTEPLTLIDPETGQETTFGNPEINVRNIQNFVDRGFEVSEGTLPARVRIGTETPEEATIQSDIEETDKELDKASAELDALRLATTELNQELIQGIKARFEIRRETLKEVNKRTLASFKQFGFRSGAIRRAASFQGILSAEERAGISRLSALDVEEGNLLVQARIAATEQDFLLLSGKIGALEATRKSQQEEVSKLNEASIKQQELILKQDKAAREEEDSLREQEKFILENTARTILNALTDDEAANAELIAGFAEQEGVDPNRLLNSVLAQKAKKDKEDFALESAKLGITTKQLNIAESRLNIAKKQQELSQKLSREGFETLTTKQALKSNRDIAKTDAFKAIRKGQDSLQFLLDFETEFKAQGEDLVFVGAEAGKLQTKYRAALLNLKEFFNLGVLNGPDLDILEDVLPNPSSVKLLVRGGGATVTAGIKSMKNQILTTIQDRGVSLKNEFANFDPEQLTNLKEIDRITTLIEDKIGGVDDTGDTETDLGGGGFDGEPATDEENDFLDSI